MCVRLCLMQQDAGRAAAHRPAASAVRLAGHPLRVADHAVHEVIAIACRHKNMDVPDLHWGDGHCLRQVPPAQPGALILILCSAVFS